MTSFSTGEGEHSGVCEKGTVVCVCECEGVLEGRWRGGAPKGEVGSWDEGVPRERAPRGRPHWQGIWKGTRELGIQGGHLRMGGAPWR